MKSSYELALERSGGALNRIDEGLKAKIAEIDKLRKAKIAEVELAYKDKFRKASDPAALEQMKDDMAVELASIRSKAEKDKQEIRQS